MKMTTFEEEELSYIYVTENGEVFYHDVSGCGVTDSRLKGVKVYENGEVTFI